MKGSLSKLAKYRQMVGMAVAALILTVIFVPFQTASAFTVDLELPNVTDTDAVPTNANGATFEVTIDVEAGELISVESVELILDNDESTVKRAVFDSDGQRTSGSSTLTRGHLTITFSDFTSDGYGYGFGVVSDGTTFNPSYSYAFTYSYAFISGNSVGYSNAVGNSVDGLIGPGTITISGKLNTALPEAGVPHTLDVLINTGTGVNPDHLVAPQLTFTTLGNSNVKTTTVEAGTDVKKEVDSKGISGKKIGFTFKGVVAGGTLIAEEDFPSFAWASYSDFFETKAGKAVFSVGADDAISIGNVYDFDASSVSWDGDTGTYILEVPYDESKIPSGVDEEDLKLFHFNEVTEEFEDITTDVDTEENVVTGETDSLSPVAVGYTESSLGGGGGGGSGGGAGGTGGGKVIVNETFPASYFATNPLKKVQVSQSGFSNAAGVNIVGGTVGQQVSINASFRNFQETAQPYAIIIQVVNEDGFTTDIGWTQGSLEPGQGADASRSWTIEESGNYAIKIFVWDGVSAGPTPLSEVSQKNFTVN